MYLQPSVSVEPCCVVLFIGLFDELPGLLCVFVTDFLLLTSQIHSSSLVNELYLSVGLHSGPHFNLFHNMRQNLTSLITAGNLQVFAILTLRFLQ